MCIRDRDEAISGALDIVAECISDDAGFRKWIRELVMREGKIESKGSSEEPTPFAMYYDYSEDVSKIPAHRILAINRGEKEKVLSVKAVSYTHLDVYKRQLQEQH